MITLRFHHLGSTLFEKSDSQTLVIPRVGEIVIFLPDGSGERVQYEVKIVIHVHTNKDTVVEVVLDRLLPSDVAVVMESFMGLFPVRRA